MQTHFATGTLAAFRAHLRDRRGPAAKAALAARIPVVLSSFERFVLLGSGWRVGLAAEAAALKLCEAAGASSEGFPCDGVPPRPHQHHYLANLGVGRLETSIARSLAQVVEARGTVIDNGCDQMVELILAPARGSSGRDRARCRPGQTPKLTRSFVCGCRQGSRRKVRQRVMSVVIGVAHMTQTEVMQCLLCGRWILPFCSSLTS